MKFFICDTPHKFKEHSYENYGKWYFYRDEQVQLHEGSNFIVLYAGYTIDKPIEEHASNFSFHDANGNFYAIKLTKQTYTIALDYFSNHKVNTATKHGIEISNYVPFMTSTREDLSDTVRPYSLFEREYDDSTGSPILSHINICKPNYDYVLDAKYALEQEKWQDTEKLTEYIHSCMKDHAKLIKRLYSNRFISLSDGIDSVLQSCYFYDDPQYIYTIDKCMAGPTEGYKWKKLAAAQFPNVRFDEFLEADAGKNAIKYLKDPTTRGYTQLPTMMYLAELETKPDIVLFGVNGNEFSFRDLYPHLLFHLWTSLREGKSKRAAMDSTRKVLMKNSQRYGANYSLGKVKSPSDLWNDFKQMYIANRKIETIETKLYLQMSPKYYNRSISCCNDIMVASLYNDRRFYHEIFKARNDYLLNSEIMDAPIFRSILKNKFNDHKFETPCKDALYSNYNDIYKSLRVSAIKCIEHRI